MLVQQLNSRIQDLAHQLEHAMFLSNNARGQMEEELRDLVEARDKARVAMEPPKAPPPTQRRRASRWSTDY